MLKNRLLTPGPVAVHEGALTEMSRPLMHHRTPQFSAIFRECATGLKTVFGTKQDVLILAGSGSLAMTGAVSNLCSPGDTVITVNGGKFGERWTKIAQKYGLNVLELPVEWGHPVNPAEVKKLLDANPSTRAVYMTASETSTATAHPVKEVAALTKNLPGTALVVDGITAVGAIPLPMDEWGVDVLVSGSQKAFMLPPGLAFAALSEKAWKLTETAKLPRFYEDFKKERAALKDDTSAWTPAVSLIVGLREVLKSFEAEGMEKRLAATALLAKATRAGCEAMGLPIYSKSPSDSVTAAVLPDAVPAGKLVKYMRDKLGVAMAAGQDAIKDRVVRISHMGFLDGFDMLTALSALETGLTQFGHKVELGKGPAAAQRLLIAGAPAAK
ncbi:MAG: alanine--glyoxylate aminotransferase family protein [Deltaproteobacteria bacterium]|nr:alanine--glyoxylate aminotransferase family protein [Deltaproteobacteria bacterium]